MPLWYIRGEVTPMELVRVVYRGKTHKEFVRKERCWSIDRFAGQVSQEEDHHQFTKVLHDGASVLRGALLNKRLNADLPSTCTYHIDCSILAAG